METYLKVYDWMSPIPPTDRLVYALVYQLTLSGKGFWSTIKSMSERLGIPKSQCRNALQNLQNIGAISRSTLIIQRRTRITFLAEEPFANHLRNR